MPGFVYFLPGASAAGFTLHAARSAGLAWIAEGPTQLEARGCTQGPGGGSGVTVYDPGIHGGLSGYFPDRQRWVKAPAVLTDGKPVWVGIDGDVDLARYRRKEAIRGGDVTLDNGRVIHLPTARQWQDLRDGVLLWSCELPSSLAVDDDGSEIRGDVVSRYRPLWDLAMRYESALVRIFQTEDQQTRRELSEQLWPASDAAQLVHLCLTTNYRFGLPELSAAGLYDQVVRNAAFSLLLDDEGFARLQKKTRETRDSGNSSSGPPQ